MASKDALFTLEVIVQCLRGSAGAGLLELRNAHTAEGPPLTLKPALGLRLLDLTPVVVDALDDETYGTSQNHSIAFGGRGKALVFELATASLRQASQPLPLWLMALARKGDADGPAILMASACIDFRGDVVHAATHMAAPSPFKRCAFRMSPVRDGSCTMTLECYVRLYAGAQRPVMGGELLLEPSAVQPSTAAPTPALGCAVATQTDAEADAGPGRPASKSESTFNSTALESSENTGRETAKLQPISGREDADTESGAYFPASITVGNCTGDAMRSPPNLPRAPAAGGVAAPVPPVSPGTPEVSSSLPLVSELVRELWQIKSIS